MYEGLDVITTSRSTASLRAHLPNETETSVVINATLRRVRLQLCTCDRGVRILRAFYASAPRFSVFGPFDVD